MAVAHATPAEVFEAGPCRTLPFSEQRTQTLIKTDTVEVIRLLVPAGKEIGEHQTEGEVIVHCLEGRVAFTAHDKTKELPAGSMLFLAGGDPHSLKALEDSCLLLTIML